MYKVSLVCNFFPKLSETFIYDYAKILIERKSLAAIFPIEKYKEIKFHKDYSLLESFVRRLRTGESTNQIDFPGWVKEVIRLTPNSNEKIYKQFSQWVPRQLEEVQTDIVHVHFLSMGGTLIAFVKEKIMELPSILELHGLDIYRIGRKIPSVSKKIFSNYDAIVVNCMHMKKCVQRILPKEMHQKIRVINHGIDVRKAPLKFQKKYDKERIHIISVCRLVEKKGIDVLLKAIPLVMRECPKVKVTIVGEGPLKKDLISLSKQLHLKNVKFKPYLSNPLVFELLKTADIFVLPCQEASDGDLDSIPSAIQEAQLMKVPVVSTRVGGIPEIVENGKTGFLVPQKDPITLSKKIIELCTDSDLRKKFGENGRKKVLKELDMNKQFKKFHKLYVEVLEERK
jgi:colanic acid/amylovoran biosynthesis glycosyltransferase